MRERNMGCENKPVGGAQEYVTRPKVESSTKIRILEMGDVQKLKRTERILIATFSSIFNPGLKLK